LEEESMHVMTVAAAGVDLIVREWGLEDGEPLLFWPALNPWGSFQLLEAAPLFVEHGFRVASVAAPGMGESPALADPGSYRPTQLASLAVEIADALSFERLGFVGASWGASIGVRLAADHPERVRALVLLDGGYADPHVDQTLPELEQQLAADQELFAFESWDASLEWARAHTRRWSNALEVRYRAGMGEAAGAVRPRADSRAAARALYGLALEPLHEAHASLGHAGVPTLLLIAADADAAEHVASFRALVKQAVVERVEAGHDVLQDDPVATVNATARWLTRIAG
jgi:pimeloyl-ACP methyl ester carboxylesterase